MVAVILASRQPNEETSWVYDVSLGTLADHAAFEDVDLPPLEDVWEAEDEAIADFREWEDM